MLPLIKTGTELNRDISTVFLIDKPEIDSLPFLGNDEYNYLNEKLEIENEWAIYKSPVIYYFCRFDRKETESDKLEMARKAGSNFFDLLKQEKTASLQIWSNIEIKISSAFIEGLMLSLYTFSKYKNKKEDYILKNLYLADESISTDKIDELKSLIQAVFHCRNLINEPLSYLTASRFAKEMEQLGTEAGFRVEVLEKKKIEALQMGGLLAVNKGSIDPPTFTIMEWKPDNAKNNQPIVLVGKGIVYDTGGLSLKPTPKSMDYMKSDMAGGAVIAATIYAASKNKLPVHVIGLVPATDNRPDGNAYVPDNVITMHDGTTVEIKNTDAEGRLVLADALSYAKKFNPLLVIDIATLTGSAEIIAGTHALVAMGNNPQRLQQLKEIGMTTYERLIELPLWEEFAKPLKSSIADLNNLGVREAQTSIAGKFLEHFVEYPWIHLDIAGVAFLHEKNFYSPSGGTGFGVRLLYHFLKLFN